MLYTQSYRDSGFEGLVPLGVAFARVYYVEGKAKCIAKLREEFEKAGVQLVFNCQFNFAHTGHPSNGLYECECLGDAYRFPKNSGAETALEPLATSAAPPGQRSKTKSSLKFKCGLVMLEKETVQG